MFLDNIASVTKAVATFIKKYAAMRIENTHNNDKYFHCKANCETAAQGAVGEAVAALISDAREADDKRRKNDKPTDCRDDQRANMFGFLQGVMKSRCASVCYAKFPYKRE